MIAFCLIMQIITEIDFLLFEFYTSHNLGVLIMKMRARLCLSAREPLVCFYAVMSAGSPLR